MLKEWLEGVRAFQEQVRQPVADISTQAPAAALASLRDAVEKAPKSYKDYLAEALSCYENHLYRAAVLLVWSANMSRLYDAIGDRKGGIKSFEKENLARYQDSGAYRKVRNRDDLLYLKDRAFLELAERAGLYNRSTRMMLIERLDLRNRCSHPTGHAVGREEAVIFIESLCQNVISGKTLNW